jgi:DNA-binding transcriptional ArsR family regulator
MLDHGGLGHGGLPPELAAGLEPRLQDALGHPVRRRILRSLNRDGSAETAGWLAREVGGESLSRVTYHLRVLVGLRVVVPGELGAVRHGGEIAYWSELVGELEALEVLEATFDADWREM